jgi:hypothetical protein
MSKQEWYGRRPWYLDGMDERIQTTDKDGGRRIRWNREWPLKSEERVEPEDRHRSVEDYHPVLRAHCRLDQAG